MHKKHVAFSMSVFLCIYSDYCIDGGSRLWFPSHRSAAQPPCRESEKNAGNKPGFHQHEPLDRSRHSLPPSVRENLPRQSLVSGSASVLAARHIATRCLFCSPPVTRG
jgi:hypothetical protein